MPDWHVNWIASELDLHCSSELMVPKYRMCRTPFSNKNLRKVNEQLIQTRHGYRNHEYFRIYLAICKLFEVLFHINIISSVRLTAIYFLAIQALGKTTQAIKGANCVLSSPIPIFQPHSCPVLIAARLRLCPASPAAACALCDQLHLLSTSQESPAGKLQIHQYFG